jgi:fermentation-respiration switch protein FrsA (DUF1100 family)
MAEIHEGPSSGGLTRNMAAVAGFMVAMTGLISALVAAGVIGGSSGAPAPSVSLGSEQALARSSDLALQERGFDCSRATTVPYGTELRTTILDALRLHEGYDGLYYVEKLTRLGEWAYVEAASAKRGVYKGYLVQFDGLEWIWRWTGPVGAKPGDIGYPPDFVEDAQGVLVCG